jgi:predicted nucleotide-binding protein (sugar kinase/HSP70/actin superfamily)
MEAVGRPTFQSLSKTVGQFNLRNRRFLIPEMNRIGAHLLAGVCRGFGINASVMETFNGLDLGKEFTSGKECFPCQVTMGDILHFINQEQERLGQDFNPANYIYFMPEATGPCRFGMYNKYQRIVLDTFPELRKLKIASLTTGDAYSLQGMIEKEQAGDLRKVSYFSVVVGDILDRLLWRIRPYEKEHGRADAFIEKSIKTMADSFELNGSHKGFDSILGDLEVIVEEGKSIVDRAIPPKPLIGVVGEIYLRTHVRSNQDIIRMLEKYGAEVVNASIAEWVDFTTYDKVREAKIGLLASLRLLRFDKARSYLKQIIRFGGDLLYQYGRRIQAYKRVQPRLDVASDHRVSHLDRVLEKSDFYSFELGTEACLSIAGIMEYVSGGCNGVANVYPFTCMPSTITSSVIRPVINRKRIPFLDAPYDGTSQPGREAAIRTFMYQAHQHFKRHGRTPHH